MSEGFAVTAYKRWYRLYTNITKSEAAIEPAVARLGVPYRAQHPAIFGSVYADFALLDEKIILEIDGKTHNSPEAKLKDRERTAKLEKLGWVVARCSNEDAEREPDAAVARMLLEARDRRKALAMLKIARSKGGRKPNARDDQDGPDGGERAGGRGDRVPGGAGTPDQE